MFGFGRKKSPEAGRENEAAEAVATIDRASESMRQLKEHEGFMKKLSKEASALRMGALLIGLMVPQESLGYGPHNRVEELNSLIDGIEEYQEKLRDDRARRLLQGRTYQVRQIDAELKRTEKKQERLRTKRDAAAERVTEAHATRRLKREKRRRPKPALELYYTASDRVDAYLQSAGVQEYGRSLVIPDVDGTMKFVDVPDSYEVYDFDYDGNDLTIILQESDGDFHGIFLEDGKYVGEGPVTNRGRKL